MTMALTDEAHEIVVHFTSHMPLDVRAMYETTVREMLKRTKFPNEKLEQCDDDEAMQATQACVNVMWMLWEQARRESKCGQKELFQIRNNSFFPPNKRPGGRKSRWPGQDE
jgi:hypothetical protein